MSHESFLSLSRFRYLKAALALTAVVLLLFFLYRPEIRHAGNTWLGYGLGTLGAGLILWLTAYGIRKRSYASTLGTVRGWLSAHVWLGLALAVVVTLHSGFEFGANVHTLAYLLTLAVIASGVWGVVIYVREPALMSDVLNGSTLQQVADRIRALDDESRALAKDAGADVQALVEASAGAALFTGRRQRLAGRNPSCATQAAVDALDRLGRERQRELRDLYALQFRRLQQLNRIREYLRLKAWTEVWLLFHVPLAFALLGALLAHVVSVFFYW